jgi:chromosome segregation ATPase
MTLHCRKREQAKKSGATFDASTMSGDDDELESIEIVTVEQKPQYYQAKVTRAVSKLEKEKALRKVTDDDPAEALDAYVKARAALSAKTDDLDELKKQVDSLNKDIAKRKKRWRDMRKKLTKNTMADFHTLMRLNGYVGDLAFKHNEGTLELSFQKCLHNTQSQTKDVKALSGGEGSFTTMCLLMALGENLETPFRILDEFDVFLDTANRKLVMNCLIHTARNMEHRQFIFITPQDLSSITVSDFVRIHRLQNPVRDTQGDGPSQQVLPF